MNSLPSAKPYYVAAFVLGALIALLIAIPARAMPALPHEIVVSTGSAER